MPASSGMSGGTTKVHSDGKRPSLKSSVIKELDEVSTKETHRNVSSQDRNMHSNSLTEMQLVKRRAKASAAKAFVGSRQAFKCFLEAFETVCTRRMRTTLDSRVSFPPFFLACVRLSLLAIKPSQNAVTFLVRSVYTIVSSKSCSIRLHFFSLSPNLRLRTAKLRIQVQILRIRQRKPAQRATRSADDYPALCRGTSASSNDLICWLYFEIDIYLGKYRLILIIWNTCFKACKRISN